MRLVLSSTVLFHLDLTHCWYKTVNKNSKLGYWNQQGMTFLSAIDDDCSGIRKKKHVSHAPGPGHVLHGPRRPGRRTHSDSPTRLGASGCNVAGGSGAPTDQDLRAVVVIVPLQRKQHSRSATRIRPGVGRNVRERLHHRVGLVVVDDGAAVDEDEEVS